MSRTIYDSNDAAGQELWRQRLSFFARAERQQEIKISASLFSSSTHTTIIMFTSLD